MKDGRGEIEIPLFPRGKTNPEDSYHVGDFGDATCTIDLKDYTFFVFKDKENPNLRTLILKPRKTK